MIIPKDKRLNDQQLELIKKITGEFGVDIMVINGTHRSIYAMIGDERHELMINRLQGLDFVDRVDRIQSPYKLMAKNNELSQHKIEIGGVSFGTGTFRVIAGQCTIDPSNPQIFLETAAAVKEAGADMLRGGVWKPRTLPHSFQGDSKSVEILMQARQLTGLPVVTEVMDAEQLQVAVEAGVDVLQIGARNALNYSLLKVIGEHTRNREIGVLLKRSIHMGTLDEFISAAEYIVGNGNPNVLLCPRGTLPGIDGYRNYPDECIIPLLKEKTWAPVVVDPSHSVGRARYVPYSSLAATAYGADGLIIECHADPQQGIGDDPKQAVTPGVLKKIIQQARKVYDCSRSVEWH